MERYFEKLNEMKADLYALTTEEKIVLDKKNKAAKVYCDIVNFGQEVEAFEHDFNPNRNIEIIKAELSKNEKIENAFLNKKETYKNAFKATGKFFLKISALGVVATILAGILLGYTIDPDIITNIVSGFIVSWIAASGFAFIKFRSETLAFRLLTHGNKLEEVQERIRELTLEKAKEQEKIKVAKKNLDEEKERLENISKLVIEQRNKINELMSMVNSIVLEFLEKDLTPEQKELLENNIGTEAAMTLGITL